MPTELEPQLLADQAKRDVADALIFTAATAMSAKIKERDALNTEIASLEADIIWAAGKNGHTDALAARTKRRAELDAEITALMVEIGSMDGVAGAPRNCLTAFDAEIQANAANDCSGMEWMNRLAVQTKRRAAIDAEITALEAEIATAKTKHADALAAKDAEITELMVEIAAAKTKRNIKLAAIDAEIAVLEAELAASKTKPNALET